MSKILELNSYSLYDELGNRDYMVYEVKYDDGHKEYVSRDVFRNLKALEIIKNKEIDVHSLMLGMNINTYESFIEGGIKYGWFREEPTEQEYNLLKEVLL